MTTSDPIELGRRFDALARAFEQKQDETEKRTAAVIVARVDRKIVGAIGSDHLLSGTTRTTGKKSSNRGRAAAGRIKAYARRERAGTLVGVTGPLQLAENDVAKHPVVSRYAKSANAQQYIGKKGKVINGRSSRQARGIAVRLGEATTGDRRAVLHWDGKYARYTFASSKGRHPWRDGVRDATTEIPKVHSTVQLEALASALKG